MGDFSEKKTPPNEYLTVVTVTQLRDLLVRMSCYVIYFTKILHSFVSV